MDLPPRVPAQEPVELNYCGNHRGTLRAREEERETLKTLKGTHTDTHGYKTDFQKLVFRYGERLERNTGFNRNIAKNQLPKIEFTGQVLAAVDPSA